MKLSAIAELYGLDDVHERCNNLLKNMRLKTLSETVHLEELDVENARHFLEQRIERLETFLDTLPSVHETSAVCIVSDDK